ncbi:MAG TPA: hypothetical protein PKE37_00150 [Thiomonas arsenitoxydans]|nr:hypothetical protein [Thiomonas arsenitoxydans]
MTTNKKAPALTEARQSTSCLHFSRILDAVTVIYCIGMVIALFAGVLK